MLHQSPPWIERAVTEPVDILAHVVRARCEKPERRNILSPDEVGRTQASRSVSEFLKRFRPPALIARCVVNQPNQGLCPVIPHARTPPALANQNTNARRCGLYPKWDIP